MERERKCAKAGVTEKATAALRHGVELPGKLFGLHELKARGHRIELAERENIGGIQYYVLRLTLIDGSSTTLHVDPNSWLITRRRDVRPLHVDVDPTTDHNRAAKLRFSDNIPGAIRIRIERNRSPKRESARDHDCPRCENKSAACSIHFRTALERIHPLGGS